MPNFTKSYLDDNGFTFVLQLKNKSVSEITEELRSHELTELVTVFAFFIPATSLLE